MLTLAATSEVIYLISSIYHVIWHICFHLPDKFMFLLKFNELSQ